MQNLIANANKNWNVKFCFFVCEFICLLKYLLLCYVTTLFQLLGLVNWIALDGVKFLERGDRYLFEDNISVVTWRDWRKPHKLLSIHDNPYKFQTLTKISSIAPTQASSFSFMKEINLLSISLKIIRLLRARILNGSGPWGLSVTVTGKYRTEADTFS